MLHVRTGSCAHPGAAASKSAPETAAPAHLVWVNLVLSGLTVDPQVPLAVPKAPFYQSFSERDCAQRLGLGDWVPMTKLTGFTNTLHLSGLPPLSSTEMSLTGSVASREVMLQKLFKSSDFIFLISASANYTLLYIPYKWGFASYKVLKIVWQQLNWAGLAASVPTQPCRPESHIKLSERWRLLC